MDLTFWIELVLFVVLLGFSAFFSSSETALFSLKSVQIENMRTGGNPRIGLIGRLLSEPRRLIVTILIGNEFVNVAASVLSAAMVIQLLGAENKFFNLFIMVPILLVFGEITPKTLAIRNNIAFATYQSAPIDLFARLISPIRWAVRKVADWFTTLIVGTERSPGNIITEDMVRTLAHEAVGEGALDHMEAQLIDHIFDLSSRTVGDLMTPRADVTFVPLDVGGGQILEIFRQSKQSRMPVFESHRDNEPTEKQMIRRTFSFTETKVRGAMRPLIDVAVVDRQANCGEARRLAAETAHIRLPVYLPPGAYSTLAGFILHKTGAIPPQGTRIDEGRYVLTVHRRSARAIQEVRICWKD